MAVELCLVVPCYNERQSLGTFLEEWLAELNRHGMPFSMMFIDGGSTDGTIETIERARQAHGEISLHVLRGLPHGPSCLEGYRRAIQDAGARWILMVDSDGQCDPRYFAEFWQKRGATNCVQGFRFSRKDGLLRLAISRVLSILVFCLSGTFVRDLNVPYRLMPARSLKHLLKFIPADLDLSNVMLSLLYARSYGIVWIPITFRQRSFGASTLNFKKMAAVAWRFVSAFNDVRPVIQRQRLMDENS